MGAVNLNQGDKQPDSGQSVSEPSGSNSQPVSKQQTKVSRNLAGKLWSLLQESIFLTKRYLFVTEDPLPQWIIDNVRLTQKRIALLLDKPLEDLEVLDLALGKNLGHALCWSTSNKVTGIDQNLMVDDPGFTDIIKMLATKSWFRLIKIVVRRKLGIDRKFRQNILRLFGKQPKYPIDIRTSLPEKTGLADSRYDVIYSFSAFEHFENPATVIRESVRLLKERGVMYTSIHLYTSHSGVHDPEIFSQWHATGPYWPHLRAEHRNSVKPNCYLNKMRLNQWQSLFTSELPGCEFVYEKQPELQPQLEKLRVTGDLAEFSDDELLTINLIVVWQKPKSIKLI